MTLSTEGYDAQAITFLSIQIYTEDNIFAGHYEVGFTAVYPDARITFKVPLEIIEFIPPLPDFEFTSTPRLGKPYFNETEAGDEV